MEKLFFGSSFILSVTDRGSSTQFVNSGFFYKITVARFLFRLKNDVLMWEILLLLLLNHLPPDITSGQGLNKILLIIFYNRLARWKLPCSAAEAAGGSRTATGTPNGGAVAAAPHAVSGENRERLLTTSRRFEAWGGSEAGESRNWKSRLGAGAKIKEGLQVRDYNLLCLDRIPFAFSLFSIFAE